jgi:hypothetical protein
VFGHLRLHLLAFLYGLDRPSSHVPVSAVRPLVVVVNKPCIKVCLELFEGEIELCPERLPEAEKPGVRS